MRLCCRIALATFELDVDVSFDARVTALFGPSGSGKTTILEAIAGLRSVASGEIEIGNRVLFSSERKVNLPPYRRLLGYVPQEGALFPHLSVKKNILFGSGRGEDVSHPGSVAFDRVIDVLEIFSLLDRSVIRLSGGESQRVALARALLSSPRLLLLDEPLASLDVGLKEKILPYLRRVRDEFAIPIIYVTHNPTEVLSLADWVIMIREGRVVAHGPPRETLVSRRVLSHLDVAEIENVFDGRLVESDLEGGRSTVRFSSGLELFVPYVAGSEGTFVQIGIRGDDILVGTKEPEGISAANVLPGVVSGIEALDGDAVVKVGAQEIFCVRLTCSAVQRLRLAEGMKVFLVIKTRSCFVL